MIAKKKVLNGVIPVTTTKAVYLDGTNKTLQEAIDNGELGGNSNDVIIRDIENEEIFEVIDESPAIVVFSKPSLSMRVGDTATVNIQMNKQPSENKTYWIVHDSKLSATPKTVVFTRDNWNQPITVTVTVVENMSGNTILSVANGGTGEKYSIPVTVLD